LTSASSGWWNFAFAPAAGTIADVSRFPIEGCSGDGSNAMSATGLDVFDKTLQTTNIWLDDIMEVLGPDRRVAWHVLGATLRVLRDRLMPGLAAHLGAQLPLLVRGTYYDQWSPRAKPTDFHSADEFLAEVQRSLGDIRPVNVHEAVRAVFRTIGAHIETGQVVKVREALPKDIRALWPVEENGASPPPSENKPPGRGAVIP
jgi:uncharacterized protein (DUF2267 family)